VIGGNPGLEDLISTCTRPTGQPGMGGSFVDLRVPDHQ
jgi:hypothetical protein